MMTLTPGLRAATLGIGSLAVLALVFLEASRRGIHDPLGVAYIAALIGVVPAAVLVGRAAAQRSARLAIGGALVYGGWIVAAALLAAIRLALLS